MSEDYRFTMQTYIKLNKHRVNEIRYIFKLRTGYDGSRETLTTRHLLDQQFDKCHECQVKESRKHILENCIIYQKARDKLYQYIYRQPLLWDCLLKLGLL